MKKTAPAKTKQVISKTTTTSQHAKVDFKTKEGKVLRVDAIKTSTVKQSESKKPSSSHSAKKTKK